MCHDEGENADLAPEVGCDKFDQLAGVHNRDLTPPREKVALVPGDQIVCAGGVGAFWTQFLAEAPAIHSYHQKGVGKLVGAQ
jgi:hypothetical protein